MARHNLVPALALVTFLALCCSPKPSQGTGDLPPSSPGPIDLIFVGPTQGNLEPCRCGGQVRGGLPRRTRLVASLAMARPDAIVIDVGDQQATTDAMLDLTVRVGQRLRVAVAGLSQGDLLSNLAVADRFLAAGIPATSLAAQDPRAEGIANGMWLSSGGQSLGMLCLDVGDRSFSELAVAAQQTITATQPSPVAREPSPPWVMVSYLGLPSTRAILAAMPSRGLVPLVVLVGDQDETRTPLIVDGVVYTTLTPRGGTVATVRLAPTAEGWDVTVEQRLVDEGPVDPVVQAWVDAYHASQAVTAVAASPSPYQRPSACLPCHEPSVAAWRAHDHGRAVATLAAVGRLTPDCLPCHDERYRREQVRAAAPDAGVECATCHGGLDAHLAEPTTPPTAGVDCLTCHVPEHSPGWDAARYRASVAAVCSPTEPRTQ